MTTQHATTNLDTAENVAPKHGMGDIGEARFVRKDLGAKRIGLAEYRMNPDQRIGFGHSHGESEEMYVVLAGSGRFKLEDEIIDVASKDVVTARRPSCANGSPGPTACTCSRSARTPRARAAS